MTWKNILKVRLEEARMLGQKHAPEEMRAGKMRAATEKDLAETVLDSSPALLYDIRRGRDKAIEQLKNGINWQRIGGSIKVLNIKVKPQVSKDRGDFANTVLEDPYPEESAIITIEYGKKGKPTQTFSFAIPPMRKYSSSLRRPKTKRIRKSIYFDIENIIELIEEQIATDAQNNSSMVPYLEAAVRELKASMRQ